MAGKGMGVATRGGGAVESGPKNRMVSKTSQKTGIPMMAKGGEVINQHKRMAMGMAAGGMMKKGYATGGAVKKKKMMASGGKIS